MIFIVKVALSYIAEVFGREIFGGDFAGQNRTRTVGTVFIEAEETVAQFYIVFLAASQVNV